jgi:hypothetical protein
MSRGCGELQRTLLDYMVNSKKPVTYAEIIAALLQAEGVNDPTIKLRPDRERAFRRALKGLCDRDMLSTLGTGRPGNPYRYTMSPICVFCREEASEVLSGKYATICFRCAGVVAQAYFEQVLPKLARDQDEEKSGDPEPDQLSAPSDVSPVHPPTAPETPKCAQTPIPEM